MKQGWEYKKLGDVCDFQGGSQPPKDQWTKNYQEGYVRMLQIRDFTQSATDFVEYVKYSKSLKLCKSDDILIGRYGASVGKILTGLEGAYNVAIIKSIPNEEFLQKEYIKNYFLSPYFQTNLLHVSQMRAAQQGFSKEDIAEFIIPIPSVEVQQSIVSELDLINELISKKKAQLADLDSLAQSLFYEMFGDPVENEKGWEVKKLGEVCEVTSSKRIFAEEYVEKGIPFYRSKEVIEKSKGQPLSIELFISEERYEEIKSSYGIPEIGDILITAVGTIGKIWVVDSDSPFYFKDGNLVWLRKTDGVDSLFFRFALTYLIDEYKKTNANGAAYNALTIAKLKLMTCIYPPLPLQQTFASRIESIEEQKQKIQSSLQDLETLLASRMQYYFD